MAYGDPLYSVEELQQRTAVDLLARAIYGEASTQSERGKRGIAFVAKNRAEHSSDEFGGNTIKSVLLKAGQFQGLYSDNGLRPNTSSVAWQESYEIARNLDQKENPIGNCLWFCTHDSYASKVREENGKEIFQYPDSPYSFEVVDKIEIEDHIFYMLSGY